MVQGTKKQVASKAEIKESAEFDEMDIFSGGLRIPSYIQKELDAKGFVGRFISLKTMTKSGGYHPKGWQPYVIDNPQVNPVTGQAEKTYKIGDLVLGYKTKQAHEHHKALLRKKAKAQNDAHAKNVKEMRDRIREEKASKHIALIEGYDENE